MSKRLDLSKNIPATGIHVGADAFVRPREQSERAEAQTDPHKATPDDAPRLLFYPPSPPIPRPEALLSPKPY